MREREKEGDGERLAIFFFKKIFRRIKLFVKYASEVEKGPKYVYVICIVILVSILKTVPVFTLSMGII